jgi:hypothetical protein
VIDELPSSNADGARRAIQPSYATKAKRYSLILAAIIGLGVALWYARPDHNDDASGWLFSLFASSAWLIALVVCIVSPRLGRPFVAVGALSALAMSELIILLRVTDPWFLFLKPFIQAFVAAFGAVFGYPFDRAARPVSDSLDGSVKDKVPSKGGSVGASRLNE